jgi:hypothetical protein
MDVNNQKAAAMATKYILSITICLIVSLTAVSQVESSHQSESQKGVFVMLDQVEFRYIIFNNSVRNFGDPEAGIRNIDVLLDEKAFSEENLKKLFRVLSKGYPKPELLLIEVITNLEQSHTPGLPQTSAEPDNPNYDNYHWATYHRDKENEFFRYNPNPPSKETKTVVLKGKDPFAAQK